MDKLKRSTRRNIQTVTGVIIFFTLFGILGKAGIIGYKLSGLLIPLGIYMMLAVSLNLVVGVLGELSLGHAGFMCIGAYVGGLCSLFLQNVITSSVLRLVLAMLVGAIAAAAAGLLVGIPILRLRGDYLAIVTLGFGEIIRSIFGNVYIVKDAAGYHFSFATPVPLENLEVATPISMTFRHFGNVLSGSVISVLMAYFLQKLSAMLLSWLPGVLGTIPFLQIGLPAILSLYFDIFSGLLQAFIFAMLTMLYISGGFPADDFEKRRLKKEQKRKLKEQKLTAK